MDDVGEKWTKTKYKEFIKLLKSMGEEKYKAFSLSLMPGEDKAFGVRIPALRKIAKSISKGDYKGFIFVCKDEYFEEIMIKGFVIGLIKNEDELLEETEKFIPLIRNWSLCDGFCSALKAADKNKNLFMPLIKNCLESKEEYTLRFAIVMLLDHYIDDEHIDFVLQAYENISSEYYYVKMAVAWGVSMCYIKYPEKTMALIEKGSLDTFTHNKSIQKICESLRVEKDVKIFLKNFKKIC